MAQENWQKIKILKLLELLQQQTDDQHPLTTTEICAKMDLIGIPCDRRTLSKDIALLNEQGYEILWRWVGKEKGYYIVDRSFSVPELKILKASDYFKLRVENATSMKSSCSLHISVILCWKKQG